MSTEVLKTEFVPQYLAAGENKFYRLLITYSLKKLIYLQKSKCKIQSPELDLLDTHNQFIILYKREGEEIYLDLARIFRKAGHKIYRIMLKNNMTKMNNRFLNLV